jgi:hypothetical protein
MHQFDILLDLIDFELVVVVPHICVVLLLLVDLNPVGVIEEVIPVEVLVVLAEVFVVGDGLGLRDAQFVADQLDRLGG